MGAPDSSPGMTRSMSGTGPTAKATLSKISGMAPMPNQPQSGAADLLMKIARCHRLAREITDKTTVQELMALAAEYERQLPHQNSIQGGGGHAK
jgi:hypothetical protein